MIYGNMNKESGEPSQVADVGKKCATQISDYFSKSGKPALSGEILDKITAIFFLEH